MGAGKTTFYETHLKEAFPEIVPPVPHRLEAILRERRSFLVEDLRIDTQLLERARQVGYTTKVLFVSTEDSHLNIGRILARMSQGGQTVPLAVVPKSHKEALESLSEAPSHADDLLIYDNTPNARGHRLVARFRKGELEKAGRTPPGWLKQVFGQELREQAKQRERSRGGRGR
jgi:predicted ABC-type ATPase